MKHIAWKAAFGAAITLGSLGALPVACSSAAAGSGTSGKRIKLEAKVVASARSRDFTNAVGWNVKPTKALLATGPLYYFDGEVIFSGLGPRTRRRWLDDLAPIRVAFAHPGHYVPGNAKGEMLTSTSVDALAGATLGSGAGVSGLVRSATFSYDAPAKGPFAGELGANAIVLEGTATKGPETRVFRAEITLDEERGTDGKTQVEGCPFTETEMEADGLVTVTVDLPLWFDQVDFTDEPVSADGKPVRMVPGLARNQLVRGTKAGLAYVFSYAAK